MRNKKLLIIILSIMLFVVALIILCASLFTVRNVTVDGDFANAVSETEKTEICSSKYFKFGSSIFSVNKNEIISNLESANPFLQVENIETKFPNTLVIHTEIRKEFYSIKVTEDEFYSIDKTGKVLKKYFSDPGLITLKGLSSTSLENIAVGKNLASLQERSISYNFYLGFYACNYENAQISSLVKRVEISENKLIVVTYNGASVGTSFEIENPNVTLCNKLIYCISTYEALTAEQQTHGTILLTEKLNNTEEFNLVYKQ